MGAQVRGEKRYRVIERLATGGMAEVFRAESIGLEGFTKAIAIKRVLPHLAADAKFIQMFLDEARLSARLNHRNIVQVFDVGRVEDTYFIVMEFVDGITLKSAMDYLRRRGETVPLPLAVHIAVEVCNGLYYAHRLKDSSGQRLDVVHRDVSPANVLLSRTGGVKIVDFGLAKAVSQLEKTDPGVLKGKFSYLAPETAAGGEADAQADQFAIGIVLWEMLAGRRLFAGETDYATTQLVRAAQVPSLRAENPGVPERLEQIVNKALAREKSDRFASVGELSRELTGFLFAHGEPVSSEDISILTHEVLEVRFTSQTVASKSAKSPNHAEHRLLEQQLAGMVPLGTHASVAPPSDEHAGEQAVPEPSQPSAATSTAGVATTTREGPSTKGGRSRALVWAGLAVVAVVAGGAWAVGTRGPLGTRAAAQASERTTTPPATEATTAPTPSPEPSAPAAADASAAAAQPAAPVDPNSLPEEPTYRDRVQMRTAIDTRLRACEANQSERFERHARVYATYDGTTGQVFEAHLNPGDFFASRPIGACILAAVRDVPSPRLRHPRWTTDYQLLIH